jgi:Tfp pilus assembly major pilin PilA
MLGLAQANANARNPTPLQAPLRLSMPDDGIAYLRLAGEDGSGEDPSPGRLQQALQSLSRDLGLSSALSRDLIRQPELLAEHPWLVLPGILEEPLEAVLLWPASGTVADAGVLVRVRSRLASGAALNEWLTRLAGGVQGLQLEKGFDVQNTAVLKWWDSVRMVVSFDPASRILYLLAGEKASPGELQTRLVNLKRREDHPLLALEKRIDDTARGPLLWLDVPRALYAWTLALKPDPEWRARTGMLAGIRGAALGWGRRDGKGRLSLVVDASRSVGLASLLPPVGNDYSLTSRGEPEWLVAFNLPGTVLLQMLEGMMSANPRSAEEYRNSKQALAEKLGVDVDRLVAALGPEMVLFGDQAGSFIGIRNTDAETVDKLLAHLSNSYPVTYRTRNLAGRTYHHMTLRMPLEQKPDQDPLDAYLARLFLQDHLYWVRDGEWLIFAQLPQPLFDRYRQDDRVVVGRWLKEKQRQRTDNALVLISAQLDDIPRTLYYLYLSGYQGLADMLELPFDPFAFPGAQELSLPQQGSYGLQLDLADPYLTLELSFEENPLEVLGGGTPMATLAVAGIAAAVAIPAYHDYLNRTRVRSALTMAGPVKMAVAEYYAGTGTLPASETLLGMDITAVLDGQEILSSLAVVNGRIVMTFSGQTSDMANRTLILTPYAGSQAPGLLNWRCAQGPVPPGEKEILSSSEDLPSRHLQSNLPERYLPAGCR